MEEVFLYFILDDCILVVRCSNYYVKHKLVISNGERMYFRYRIYVPV